MNPEHQQMAKEECWEFEKQGLIEKTTSLWACHAFYVNKRAEQARGKQRLVITYKLLNEFLADDKFPLPNRNSLFSSLSKAQIFSKFDLKARFWQLGIQPSERPKTAFCVPNHHYQGTVLPFGLKTTPSRFQKAMTRIYGPLLDQAPIYIDDILLFSPNVQAHKLLLQKFIGISEQHGIMLFEKKMHIGLPQIEFLGMQLSQGKYEAHSHIAQELLKFPDENLTKVQIQQFLGIINYLKNFVPKLLDLTKPLSDMLKKESHSWTALQTKAIQQLKENMTSLSALQIPSDGKRILQTDTSDKHRGAVLIEEDNKRKRRICSYKSGHFKDSQLYYYSSFKELLAIKMGIQKFEFHLIWHYFLVETDFATSRGMLNSKTTTPQLLRLAAWFDQYSFDIKHIKGKDNIIPGYLSRPINSQSTQPPNIIPLIPAIYIMASSSSSYSLSPAGLGIITHTIPRSAPNDALSLIISKYAKQNAIEKAKNQQITLLQ